MSSEPTDADVRFVLSKFRISRPTVEPLADAGGFSGARIWRVRSHNRIYCLKRWPPIDPRRHGEIIRLVDCGVRQGLIFIPAYEEAERGRCHVDYGGRLWDFAEWMPGCADYRQSPSPTKLRAACIALAALHGIWEEFRGPPQPCPAVVRRLAAVRQWEELLRTGFRPTISPADPVSEWAERAWHALIRQLPIVPEILGPWQNEAFPIQPCLCNVWHDHVLFTGDEVTGLIDFGAVKTDNVAIDLARLLGSIVGDDRGLVELGLDAYSAVQPLSRAERELVPLLDQTGVVLGLANWLRWLYRDGREFADRSAVVRRMSELVLRAEKQASIEP